MKKPRSKKSKSKRRKDKITTAGYSVESTEAKGVVGTSNEAPAATPKKTVKPAVKSKSEPTGPRVWWEKSGQFFREVKVELKKVTWPTRKETVTTTSVVVVLVLVAATFLGLIDLSLSKLIRTLVG